MNIIKTVIISVTESGDEIAEKINSKIEKCQVYYRKDVKSLGLKTISEKAMKEFKSLIFVSSTGIAVRAVAPYIKSKDKDPAVLVIDSTGKVVISLLSGHLGGANELTYKVAEILGAQPIITTATDNLSITAPDIIAKENNLVIEDLKKAKEIAAQLVQGKKVIFKDDKDLIKLPQGYFKPEFYLNDFLMNNLKDIWGAVWVTHKIHSNQRKSTIETFESNYKDSEVNIETSENNYKNSNVTIELHENNHKDSEVNVENAFNKTILRLIRRDIVLGIGCRKDFDQQKMLEKVLEFLKSINIDYRAVKTVATVEVKAKEKAIINLASYLKADLKIFTLQEIKEIQHRYEGSDFVEKTIGVRCVSDPCTELAGGELLVHKVKLEGMTLSVGEAGRVESGN